jgi:hypothetical protein
MIIKAFQTAGIQARIGHFRRHARNAFEASRLASLEHERRGFLEALHTCTIHLEQEYGELLQHAQEVN